MIMCKSSFRSKLSLNNQFLFLILETDELLQTTNLQLSNTNHFDSINGKKSLINVNSNCSLIDDKQIVQSGKKLFNESVLKSLI